MPILKSSKKGMRQSAARKIRNFPIRSELKTYIKKILLLVKENKAEEAKALLPQVYKVIDMASKKNIIHKKNAARKKSRISKMLNPSKAKAA